MPFTISIKQAATQPITIQLEIGEQLFLLGANGTGKSSLMLDFSRANREAAVRVSAHRQSWFSSSDIGSPQELRQFTTNLPSWDTDHRARWIDHAAEQRPRMAITQLVELENARARRIALAADERRMDEVENLSKTPSAIRTINELLRLSNLSVTISLKDGDQVVARKNGGKDFSIAELSDGERNALVIASTVLTAPAGRIFLIDEPERHLHRSIISPLLTELFARRPDCTFVVSTHEVMLPIDHPRSRVLLVRGCTYDGSNVSAYHADLLPPEASIDDKLKMDILGARQKILFVEGTGQSLDKPLYSLLFPAVSVIAKANCREVEQAVRGIRDAQGFHWVKPFGIVDGDGRAENELDELKTRGVHAVAAYSVESVYYHVDIQRRVAERLAKSVGGNAAQRLDEAKAQVLTTISQNSQRLSERIAEKEIRAHVLGKLPKREDIVTGVSISIVLDPKTYVSTEKSRLQKYIDSQDLASIINRYPIRETAALDQIAQRLGFQSRKQYEGAVLTLLQEERESVQFVRSLFGTLSADIEAA